MACECELLKKAGEEIHRIPSDVDSDVCQNFALVKFDVCGEGMWLCPACVGHHIMVEA